MARDVVTKTEPTFDAVEAALIDGDLSKLTPDQRLSLYKKTCESVGLNPLTQPFQYIKFEGRLQLYCTRAATEQLRAIHGVSIKLVDARSIDSMYVVKAQAQDKHSRFDESTGAVSLVGLRGKELSNAWMRAETKAKRRVTLSICGLGWLDEAEVGDIQGAEIVAGPLPTAATNPQALPISEPLPATLGTDDPLPQESENPGEFSEGPDTLDVWVRDAMVEIDGCETLAAAQRLWKSWAAELDEVKTTKLHLYDALVKHAVAHKSQITAQTGVG